MYPRAILGNLFVIREKSLSICQAKVLSLSKKSCSAQSHGVGSIGSSYIGLRVQMSGCVRIVSLLPCFHACLFACLPACLLACLLPSVTPLPRSLPCLRDYFLARYHRYMIPYSFRLVVGLYRIFYMPSRIQSSAVNLKGILPRRAPMARAVHAAGGLVYAPFPKFLDPPLNNINTLIPKLS